MPKESIKKFKVTKSLRLQKGAMTVTFFAALALFAFAVVSLLVCLIIGELDKYILGLLVILAMVSALWIFAFKLISVNSYGFSMVSFGDKSMRFYLNEITDDLSWSSVADCGMIKNLWITWVYVSNHELDETERSHFPDNTGAGTFYFEYEENAFNEFMKYLPERFREEMLRRRDELIKKK